MELLSVVVVEPDGAVELLLSVVVVVDAPEGDVVVLEVLLDVSPLAAAGGVVLLVVAGGGVTDGLLDDVDGGGDFGVSLLQPATASAANTAAIIMRFIFFLDYFSELKRISAHNADAEF